MTIVIAQRRGEEILMLSDTMIDDRGQTRPNVMPGRLKVVTIGPRVTVAFAGDADPAGVIIREARSKLRHSGLPAAIQLIKAETAVGAIDFLVASHHPEARLIRLRKGVVLEIPDICALGHDEPFIDIIDQARKATDDLPLRRGDLRLRFFDRLMTNKNLSSRVGGFPITLEATPTGHRYLHCTGAYTYTFPEVKWGEETSQSIDQVYSGDGHFQLSIIPSEQPDVPVVGACLLQARTGYVFSPLEQPEAFLVQLAPHNEPWEGQEHRMFDVLKQSVAAHAITAALVC